MIEVILQGKLPVDEWFHGKCDKCGSVFKATVDEHTAPWRVGRRGRPVIVVNCPTIDCVSLVRCRKEAKAK